MLKSLNLSEAQAAMYLATLELGQATMQAIAKKSGIKRTSIYNFIEEMKERQLIVETRKKKRNVYSAVAPSNLVEIEKARLRELEVLMPELTAIQNKGRNKPRVTFYEGLEGIKEVYADSLKERSLNSTPEDAVNQRLAGLGDEWRIVSANTSIALHGNFARSPSGDFGDVAKHAYYVTTVVAEKQ